MATTRDVIRYNIHKCSTTIAAIKYDATTIKSYINPRLGTWGMYVRYKYEVSVWLTVLSLIKVSNDEHRTVMVHTSLANKRRMIKTARDRLTRLSGKIERNPAKYTHVDEWVAARQAAILMEKDEVAQ